jgi:hypothetical protein
MRRLNKNYWRFGWILLTNGALIFLLLSGPIRVHHDQQVLHEALGTAPEPFSYWKQLIAAPWVPVVALVLLVGIGAEVRRTALSPIFNLGPYVVWLLVALWERARVVGEAPPYELYLGKVLLIIPLTVVVVVNLVLYALAFRRRQADGGDLGLPSRV